MTERAASQSGFTVIEAVVALALLAAGSALLVRAASQAHVMHRRNAQQLAALDIAKSKLAAAGIESRLLDGSQEGREREFSWRVTMTPGGQTSSSVRSSMSGFWTTAEVSWGGDEDGRPHTVRLTSFKLANPSSAP